KKFRRSFSDADTRISMPWDYDDTGIHAQIFKKGSVHYRCINAVCAALRQTHSGHAHSLAHAFMIAQRGGTFYIREPHTLQNSKNGPGFAVGFLLLLRLALPAFIARQAMVRS